MTSKVDKLEIKKKKKKTQEDMKGLGVKYSCSGQSWELKNFVQTRQEEGLK